MARDRDRLNSDSVRVLQALLITGRDDQLIDRIMQRMATSRSDQPAEQQLDRHRHGGLPMPKLDYKKGALIVGGTYPAFSNCQIRRGPPKLPCMATTAPGVDTCCAERSGDKPVDPA